MDEESGFHKDPEEVSYSKEREDINTTLQQVMKKARELGLASEGMVSGESEQAQIEQAMHLLQDYEEYKAKTQRELDDLMGISEEVKQRRK